MREEADRVECYARGDSHACAEIDGWIRAELGARYSGLRPDHEDLVQTVHEKLLVNVRGGRFAQRSSLRSYVTSIVRRTAVDRLREIYRDRALLATSLTAADSLAGADPPKEPERLDERMLRQVLVAMPPGCRELWRLALVERLDYPAIAERLRIPPGTVKSRMWSCRCHASAALARLRLRAGRDAERLSSPCSCSSADT